MTPLILRPQPAADELAALLRRQGHTPVVCPLLSYLPGSELGALSDRLSQADIVISISVAAVQYASEQLASQQLSWPKHCIYLAVGATSRHIAYAGGVAADGTTPCDTRTPQQKSALEHYVRDFVARFPGAAVVGHNELAAKACPSFDVQAWLRETGIL
jgi:hypothetical protein